MTNTSADCPIRIGCHWSENRFYLQILVNFFGPNWCCCFIHINLGRKCFRYNSCNCSHSYWIKYSKHLSGTYLPAIIFNWVLHFIFSIFYSTQATLRTSQITQSSTLISCCVVLESLRPQIPQCLFCLRLFYKFVSCYLDFLL